MLSAASIKRLADQVTELEARSKPHPPKVVSVSLGEGIDKDVVLARHFELYPEDNGPELVVFLTIYEGENYTAPEKKHNRAWFSLKREAGND
jgi:hypothetical protein